MFELASNIAERVRESSNPAYAAEKTRTKKGLDKASNISKLVLIGSLALSILGIALLPTTVIGGAVLLFFSVPISYFSYNGMKVFENFKTIVDNPSRYQYYIPRSEPFDTKKVKEDLTPGTFYFDWFINSLIKKAAKPLQNNV